MPIALSPLVRKYIATDLPDLVPLIRKNVSKNLPTTNSVTVEPLDWHDLLAASQSFRSRSFPHLNPPVDLILAVDCIYHPSLLPSFIEVIDYFSIPIKTIVIVAVELRAEEVIREFISQWSNRRGWQIYRVGGGLWELPFVVWVGWKTEPNSNSPQVESEGIDRETVG